MAFTCDQFHSKCPSYFEINICKIIATSSRGHWVKVVSLALSTERQMDRPVFTAIWNTNSKSHGIIIVLRVQLTISQHYFRSWLGAKLATSHCLAKSMWKVEYPTGTSPTDADAIAAATVQTSAVIIYTLYDSSWSQDSCIRTSKSNRVVYNHRFSLVSVNVRVKLQWLQLEWSENQQPIPGPRMRL